MSVMQKIVSFLWFDHHGCGSPAGSRADVAATYANATAPPRAFLAPRAETPPLHLLRGDGPAHQMPGFPCCDQADHFPRDAGAS